MGTSNAKASAKAIDDRIERFIGDILDMIRRVRQETLSAALGIAAGRTAQARLPSAKRPAAGPPSSRKRGGKASPPPRSAVGLDKERTAAATPAKARRGRIVVEPSTVPVSENGAPEAMSPSDREAAVIDAVRALVRATAAEISRRSGLPNGSVYAMLRSLAMRGQVAKIETARGVEYGLVSAGGIRPFKRAKAAPAQDPSSQPVVSESPAAEAPPPTPAPTGEPQPMG